MGNRDVPRALSGELQMDVGDDSYPHLPVGRFLARAVECLWDLMPARNIAEPVLAREKPVPVERSAETPA